MRFLKVSKALPQFRFYHVQTDVLLNFKATTVKPFVTPEEKNLNFNEFSKLLEKKDFEGIQKLNLKTIPYLGSDLIYFNEKHQVAIQDIKTQFEFLKDKISETQRNVLLLQIYTKEMNVAKVEELLEKKEIPFTRSVVLTLIQFYSKIAKKEKLEVLLQLTFLQTGLIHLKVLNSLLEAFAILKDKEKFELILTKMREHEVVPNVKTFKNCLEFYLSSGDKIKASEYQQLLQSYDTLDSTNIKETMMIQFIKKKEFFKCKNILEQIESLGIEKSNNFYFVLLDLIYKSKDFELYEKYKEEFEKKLSRIEYYNIKLRIDYLKSNDFSLVSEFKQNLTKESLKMNNNSFLHLLYIYKYEKKEVDDELFSSIIENQSILSIKVFNNLIDLYSPKKTNATKVELIVQMIKDLKLSYNHHTYASLLKFYRFNQEKMKEIAQEIETNNVQLTKYGLKELIYFYFNTRQTHKMVGILKKLEVSEEKLELRHYNLMMIPFISKNGKSFAFERAVLLLHKSGLIWDKRTFEIVISGYMNYDNTDKVKKYILDSKKANIQLDPQKNFETAYKFVLESL